MSALFIDSSYDITLGLLKESREWHDLRVFRGQKASGTLQTESHKILQDFNVPMKELKAVISIAGPGFYTGLRLSEGFSDVTKFFGIPHYSFYSYEIPAWLGYKNYSWVTKAYRGEYFIYEYVNGSGQERLLASKDLPASFSGQVFLHSQTSLDEKLTPLTVNGITTSDLLKSHSFEIFSRVLDDKLHRDSFYFRAPEDEFRMNP